jgi:hypothetical protein
MADATGSDTGSQVQAAKDEATDRAHDLTAATAEHVGAVKDDAKQKAVDVAHQVRRELETQGDAQAKRVASTLQDVGGQLRGMADGGGDDGAVAEATRKLAEKSQQVAQRLEEGGMSGVGDDLRDFARRQPGLFLAAAGVAGFVVTRVLRNASQPNGAPSSQAVAASPTSVPGAVPLGATTPQGLQ